MKRIKILHLIESLTIGGAERRLINDLKFIDKDRFSNVVCCIRKDDDLRGEIEKLGIEVFSLEEYATGHLRKLLYLIRYLSKNKIDILHSQIFWADIYGRVAGKISGVKHIFSTVQGTPYTSGISYLNSSKRKFLDGITGRWSNTRFIAVSEFARDSTVQHLHVNRDLIEVIYNYIDYECWQEISKVASERLRDQLGLSEDDVVLITVGRLNPPKGHTYVLEVIPSILEEWTNSKYLIVGDGPSREMLRSLTRRLGIEQHVIFTGNRMDVKEIIHLSDIFILPTLSEGLSIALLEAMALGKPCIVTSIPPNLEIIKDMINGLTVTPGDSESIKEAILFLIRNGKERERMGLEGQKTVKDKFGPKRNIKLLEDYYLKVYYQ